MFLLVSFSSSVFSFGCFFLVVFFLLAFFSSGVFFYFGVFIYLRVIFCWWLFLLVAFFF